MSNTHKDKPSRIRFNGYWDDEQQKPKQRKQKDTTWHWWRATPSWWTSMMMNKPQRKKIKQLERAMQKQVDLDRLDEIELKLPNGKHKPHLYYW